MTPHPAPTLKRVLEESRQYLLESVAGLSEEEASRRAEAGKWSVLDCLEHLVIVEARFMGWIENGRARESERSWEKETKLWTLITDRSTKVQAPEAVVPTGSRFQSLSDAITAFTEARDRSANIVAERGAELYSIGATHPRFGDMNGSELVHLMCGHVRRHADQIREIRGME